MLYLDCSCLNLALGIFLKFLEFFGYFSWLYGFIQLILDLSLHRKNISKKTFPIYLGRARGLDPDLAGPPAPDQPLARRGPSGTGQRPNRRRRHPGQACPGPRSPI
jgi:hypothetical protein